MTRLVSIVACALVLGCMAVPAWAVSRYEAPRVVAFGDVHGAYDALTELLVQVGVVDEQLVWQAGDAHLVSLGDLLDRGPDSRAVLDLLRRLQTEAAAAGGRVHVLLGNHELMNLTGDLRYVSAGERLAFAAPGTAPDETGLEGLRAAYAPDGPYGRWLLAQPVTVVINDTAFVHGGLSPLLRGQDPDTLNDVVRERLVELLALRDRLTAEGVIPAAIDVHDAAEHLAAQEQSLSAEQRANASRFAELVRDPLFGDDGPFWYRGNAWCHPLIEAHGLAAVLEQWDVQRVVVGHTPTHDHQVHARLDGKVLLADTGMLASYYGGRASAVVIEAGAVTVHYAGRTNASPPVIEQGAPLDPLQESRVLAALAGLAAQVPESESWQSLSVDGGEVAVRVTKSSGRVREAELAALRLDRLLGLNVVAPVAPSNLGGRDALAVATWPGMVTEGERAAAQGAGPPACAGGSVFDLLYAFDALIGNEGRSPQTIIYEPRTRRLGSISHGDSFGSSSRFPAYLQSSGPHAVPALLAARLTALDEATLRAELGDLLKPRQIRALLARRDRLLDEWTVEN